MIPTHSARHDEHVRKKRRQLYIRLGIVCTCLCVLVALLSWISHQSFARITSIELQGGTLVRQSDIEPTVRTLLAGSYVWLFPRDTILLYPHDALEKTLLEDFHRIKTIDTHVANTGTLTITISERTPVAQWCTTENASVSTTSDPVVTHLRASTECYFVDDQGTIFAEAPLFSGDAYFRYFGGTASSSPVGSMFMSSISEFETISGFVQRAREEGLHPQSLYVGDRGEYSLIISGGGRIIFNTQESIDDIYKNLEVVLRTPVLSPQSGEDIPVEYIDLRYGNKVFYKLK